MKALQTKANVRPVEPEQESYGLYCIESAFAGFIEACKGMGRSRQTLERHHSASGLLRRYLDERGIAGLSAITPQVMAGFQSWLYQARSRYRKPYSIKSQIIILNSLQVFFKHLHKTGIIHANPAEAIRLPREPRQLPGTILSTREMTQLLRQPDTATVLGFRDRTMYELLYTTGLRVSELIGLRIQDIILPAEASAKEGHASGTVFIQETKYAKDRYVPFGETAGRYLAEYLDHVRPVLSRRPNSGTAHRKSESPTVFLSRCGRALDDGGVQQKLRIYAQRANIKKHLTIHVFRHTLATEMLRRGADLRQIQEMLGHRNLRATQIYTHIVKGELKRVQAHCHPREQVDLPGNFVRYRGRGWVGKGEQ